MCIRHSSSTRPNSQIDTLLIGGNFTSVVGGPTVNNIAAWANDTYTTLGSGLSGEIDTMLTLDDTLYIGGWFRNWVGGPAEGMTYAGSWGPLGGASPGYAPLGSGLNSIVFDLAKTPTNVIYMAGQFTATTSGTSMRNITRWTPGSTDDGGYRPVGLGLDGRADVLLVDDTHQLLYVGGMHTFACGDATCAVSDDDTVTTNRIGVYDLRTHTWSGLADDSGVGLNQTVSALALDDSSIYVGGFFTESTGGTPLSRIARWTWRPPSSTVNVTGDPGSTVTIGGQGFIGVNSVTIGDQPATIDYTASSSTQLTVTIPGGLANGTYPISVTAVGGTATLAAVAVIGTTPTSPQPPVPPSEPIDVMANGDSASAIVSWSAPRAPGSFPVTHYQVVATPSGRTCLTTTLTCTVTGLPRGVAQTVRVRALNGAGWGPMSDAVPVPSIWLSARRDGRQILLSGQTAGVGMGAIVTVWMDTGKGFRERKRTTPVALDGTFTWQTRLKRDVPVRTYVTVGSSRSNVITFGGSFQRDSDS